MRTTSFSLFSVLSSFALIGSLYGLVPMAAAEGAPAAGAGHGEECPGVTSRPVPGLGKGAPEVKTAHCGCSKGYSQGGCAKCNGLVPPTSVGDAESNAAPAPKASGCGCQGGK